MAVTGTTWGNTGEYWTQPHSWTLFPRENLTNWLYTAAPATIWGSMAGATSPEAGANLAWQEFSKQYQQQTKQPVGSGIQKRWEKAWRDYYRDWGPQIQWYVEPETGGELPTDTGVDPVKTEPGIYTGTGRTPGDLTVQQPPAITEIPDLEFGATAQQGIEQWQREGFDSWQDWFATRVQPFNDMMLQVLEQRPTTDLSQLPYGDIGSLLEEAKTLGGGQWEEQAESSEARQMGFFDAEGNPDVAGLRAWKQQGRTPEGLSPEREATMRREQAISEQTAQESARKMAEAAYGASGGMIAKMQEAYDEANRAIVDDRLRFEIETANEDFMAQMAQGERYDRMLAQGQVAYQDYLTMKQQMVGTALQGYFQQANLMLETYQTEWNAIGQQAQMVIDAASLSMGTDEHVLNMTRQTFEAMLEPYLAQLGFENLEAMNEAIRQGTLDANLGVFVDFINVIANVIGAVV